MPQINPTRSKMDIWCCTSFLSCIINIQSRMQISFHFKPIKIQIHLSSILIDIDILFGCFMIFHLNHKPKSFQIYTYPNISWIFYQNKNSTCMNYAAKMLKVQEPNPFGKWSGNHIWSSNWEKHEQKIHIITENSPWTCTPKNTTKSITFT